MAVKFTLLLTDVKTIILTKWAILTNTINIKFCLVDSFKCCLFTEERNGNKTPDTALALLQTAAAECEERSEEMATKFQNKELTIDEYLEQFMMERKLMHVRKLKIEKMIEIMRKRSQNIIGRANIAYPSPTNFYTPFPMHTSNPTFPPFWNRLVFIILLF